MKEFPAVLGILTRSRAENLNSWQLLWVIISHSGQISWVTFAISMSTIVFLCVAMKYLPRVPWQLFLLIAGVIVGLTADRTSHVFRFKTFGGELNKDSNFQVFLQDVFRSHFYNTGLLAFKQPIGLDFFLNSAFLAIITILESATTIRLSMFLSKQQFKVAQEFYGISVSNIVAGLIGLLPLGFPITRNMISLSCRARSSTYTLFSLILLVVFTLVFLKAFTSMPIIIKAIMNVSLAVYFVDPLVMVNYIRTQPRYGLLSLSFVIISLFVEVSFCVFFFYVIFFFFYMQQSGNYSYSVGSINDLKTQIEFSSLRRDREMTLEGYLKAGEDKLKDSTLGHLDRNLLIYQFRGLFGFLHTYEHISNMKLTLKHIIILDFRYVHLYDIELIGEYYKVMARIAKDVRFLLYITGIPEYLVENSTLIKRTWVSTLAEKNRMIYIN